MPWMTVKEVAKYLALSERTVYKLVREGIMPASRIGGVYRLDSDEIERWARSRKTTSRRRKALKLMADDQTLGEIAAESDPLRKKLLFVGLLTKKLRNRPSKPVIVGDSAVEFYTAGGYSIADIDIVYPSDPLDKILASFGLHKEGRYWFSEELGIVLEAPSAFLDAEAKKRIVKVTIEDLSVYLLGVEDLTIDRLNAFVHWRSSDDGNWARELMAIHRKEIDWVYLRLQAKKNGVDEALSQIAADLGKENEND